MGKKSRPRYIYLLPLHVPCNYRYNQDNTGTTYPPPRSKKKKIDPFALKNWQKKKEKKYNQGREKSTRDTHVGSTSGAEGRQSEGDGA